MSVRRNEPEWGYARRRSLIEDDQAEAEDRRVECDEADREQVTR